MPKPTTDFERALAARGFCVIAGVDEAGRGALAGPVVAAAAVMPPDAPPIPGVRDSKLVSAPEREALYAQITTQAVAWGVGVVDNTQIDLLNIRQATLLAMRTAVQALHTAADYVLIDGNDGAVGISAPCHTIIGGDGLCYTIAAASIIAKVTRDRIMQAQAEIYPQYGFAGHKGYGTLLHRQAIVAHGASPIHRATFLRKVLADQQTLF